MTEIAIVAVADWEDDARAMETYARADYFTAVISGVVGTIALNSEERICLADNFDFVLRVLDRKPLSSTRLEKYLWNRAARREAIEKFKKRSVVSQFTKIGIGKDDLTVQWGELDAIHRIQESTLKAALDLALYLEAPIEELRTFVEAAFSNIQQCPNDFVKTSSSATRSLENELQPKTNEKPAPEENPSSPTCLKFADLKTVHQIEDFMEMATLGAARHFQKCLLTLLRRLKFITALVPYVKTSIKTCRRWPIVHQLWESFKIATLGTTIHFLKFILTILRVLKFVVGLLADFEASFKDHRQWPSMSAMTTSSPTNSSSDDLRVHAFDCRTSVDGHSSGIWNQSDQEPQTITASELPKGSPIGEYRIIKLISRSPWSLVYLAQDVSGASWAIKEYLPSGLAHRWTGEYQTVVAQVNQHAYGTGLNCFFNQGRALRGIFHPNVVPVRDCFFANETAYIVMQYETGYSLQELVLLNRSSGREVVMSERFIRRVFGQIMFGLREVHGNRLLHLDLRPGNIVLRMNGAPILLGFDTARVILERDMSEMSSTHCRGFAAPERFEQCTEPGPWTDVYSIGACIYACMSGKPPQDTKMRLKDDRMPQALSAMRGLYSDQLISMVESCLHLSAVERPQSVDAVQKRLIDNAPVGAGHSLFEPTGTRIRRLHFRDLLKTIDRLFALPFGPRDPWI